MNLLDKHCSPGQIRKIILFQKEVADPAARSFLLLLKKFVEIAVWPRPGE
jgi:hypothetical protein